jgi:gamma-glutamyltranspeptidase/glutathione hydrolase
MGRRTFLATGLGCIASDYARGTELEASGRIEGEPTAARVGEQTLAAGGNAVDAVVAAALAAAVVAPHQCGVGGYGGHAIVARADGSITAIDFNSAAPLAATPNMFPTDANGRVKDQANTVGWLAVGVPGVLAGLELTLDLCGTKPLHELLGPAIRMARNGFVVDQSLANAIRAKHAQLSRDPGSRRLYFPTGTNPAVGSRLANPELAQLLESLAKCGTVEPFYRGAVADRISAAIKAGGGLVTSDDLARYRARQVPPLSITWGNTTIWTPPPTAGGLSVLQALATLQALAWQDWTPGDPRRLPAFVETLRLTWHDRLELLGDPQFAKVPSNRLLSSEYAAASAKLVAEALRTGRPTSGRDSGRSPRETINLCAADRNGTFVALTFTHGEAFGAQVTVDGLGLTLGHGMTRFDPRPNHPNAPGPGKRPLHNMCPTLVVRDDRAVAALGGRGGRRIPNTLIRILAELVGRGAHPRSAIDAPRVHTEGDRQVQLEVGWPESDKQRLDALGYKTSRGAGAYASIVYTDPQTGQIAGMSR